MPKLEKTPETVRVLEAIAKAKEMTFEEYIKATDIQLF